METTATLDTVIDNLRGLAANTRADQLTEPTPCAKWTVRDLFNHIIGGGHLFAAAIRGDQIDVEGPVPDMVGDDHLAAFDSAIADFRSAISQPGAMERTAHLPFADLPGAAIVQLATYDLTVHSWDLATATGQRFEPPTDLAAHCEQTARMFIQPEYRDGDMFAQEVEVGPDATPLERLLAFTGRQP
jgi:uncharacterized protein (TIGR03086 family)